MDQHHNDDRSATDTDDEAQTNSAPGFDNESFRRAAHGLIGSLRDMLDVLDGAVDRVDLTDVASGFNSVIDDLTDRYGSGFMTTDQQRVRGDAAGAAGAPDSAAGLVEIQVIDSDEDDEGGT